LLLVHSPGGKECRMSKEVKFEIRSSTFKILDRTESPCYSITKAFLNRGVFIPLYPIHLYTYTPIYLYTFIPLYLYTFIPRTFIPLYLVPLHLTSKQRKHV